MRYVDRPNSPIGMTPNIYVFPDGGGWSVKRGGASVAVIATHYRRDDAVAFARVLAHADGAQLIVVNESGVESVEAAPAHG
jgi:hypothetical protein